MKQQQDKDRGDPRQFGHGEQKDRQTHQQRFDEKAPRNPQGAEADRLDKAGEGRDRFSGEKGRNPQDTAGERRQGRV